MKNLNFYVSWDLVRMECCAVIVRIISLKAQLLRIILVKSVHRWLSPWGHCSFSLTPSSVHLKQIARMHHPSHPPVTSVVFWPFWAVSWLWAGGAAVPNSHWSALQWAPTPPLVYKRSPNWVWEKMDWVASLPSSWSASFPIKIIVPCSSTFSPNLLACCAVSRMSLGSVTCPALLVCAMTSPTLFSWL